MAFDLPLAEPRLSRLGRALLSGRALGVAVGLAVLTLLLFGLVPRLDLAAAGLFYEGGNRFIGQSPSGEALRRVLSNTPFVVLATLAGLWALRRFARAPARLWAPVRLWAPTRLWAPVRLWAPTRLWAPSGRGLVFLLASLAIGPGLLVNVVLKDHSHRPRPIQVEDFGGTLPFRPAGHFDGACRRNCSFISGEGSVGFWMLAPALLAPSPLQPVLLAATTIFAVATSLLRMAFGGHFLSDTILAALSSWIVIILVWRLIFGRLPRGM